MINGIVANPEGESPPHMHFRMHRLRPLPTSFRGYPRRTWRMRGVPPLPVSQTLDLPLQLWETSHGRGGSRILPRAGFGAGLGSSLGDFQNCTCQNQVLGLNPITPRPVDPPLLAILSVWNYAYGTLASCLHFIVSTGLSRRAYLVQ